MPVELDFFALEKQKPPSPFSPSSSQAPAARSTSSVRYLQRAISRIDPQIVRSLIASSSTAAPPLGSAPLTIFYNGAVAVFDVPKEKADEIIRMAEEGNAGGIIEKGDLPVARRKSLQRFLEKRKERLTASGPYSSKDSGEITKKSTHAKPYVANF